MSDNLSVSPLADRTIGCLLFAIASTAVASPLFTSNTASAAVFADFDTSRHSRFMPDGTPNTGFLINESMISGVGVGSQAVLITPQHYLSARHFPDNTPTFRGGDGVLRTYSTSGYVDLTTHLGTSTFTSDIRLYTLDEEIPDLHDVKPIALFDDDAASLLAQEFYLMGRNNEAGMNVIDATTPATLAGGANLSHTIFYTFDTATNGGSNMIADEAGLLPGDSGSAALIKIGDELAVLGTHFGISAPAGNSAYAGDLYYNYSTLVTPYLSEIESVVAADGQSISMLSFASAVAVPEPSSLAGLFAALLVMRRRRRGSRSRQTSGRLTVRA